MPAKKSRSKPKRNSKTPDRRRKSASAAPRSARRPDSSGKAVIAAPAETVRRAGKLFSDLVTLMVRLRGPGGCPWDREQTHATLRTYLLEETYEVLEALDNREDRAFAEELGDLLLQIVFHAEIARQEGRFDITDVVSEIHSKMVRRHPHVFGDVEARTAAQVLKNWEQLKLKEKAAAGGENENAAVKDRSILDAVPRGLPALLEAYQLTRRAAKVGFDWKSVDGIFEKLHEETEELQRALTELDKEKQEEEIGDLLFVLVNLSRFLGFDPEVALKGVNRKFKERFHIMEASASAQGAALGKMSQEELEESWQAAKVRLYKSATAKSKS